MAAHCGGATALESTLAATVAAAWPARLPGARADAQYWLATPVHYFAGLDSVHLHPMGVLQLAAEEQTRCWRRISRACSPTRGGG